jgi:methoxymalonate biosynthesis acyl carrier protein
MGDDSKLKIRAFLTRRFPSFNLRDDEDVTDAGFVNSIVAMEMVSFVEKEFGIKLARQDLVMDNFRTINALASLIDRAR